MKKLHFKNNSVTADFVVGVLSTAGTEQGTKSAYDLLYKKYGPKVGLFRWKDIELDTSEWVAIASDITEQLDGKLAVRPLDLGQSPFVFRAIGFKPGYYEARLPGQVHAINIDMPLRILVVPGDVVEIAATIEHADDKTLIWSNSTDSYGPVNEGNRNKTETSPAHVDFRTPSDASKYPIMITAKSQASKGLRAPQHDPIERIGYTLLVAGDVLLSPSWACIPSGESRTFSVDTAYKDAQIRWLPEQHFSSVQGSSATFTAPKEKGTYEITVEATYSAHDGSTFTASDTATVKVGACKCWASIKIGGNPMMYVQDDGNVKPPPGTFLNVMARGPFFHATLSKYGGMTFGPPSSYDNPDDDAEVDASMLTGGGTFESSAFLYPEDNSGDIYAYGTDDRCIGCTIITSFDGKYVEGTSSGPVAVSRRSGSEDQEFVPYHLEFKLPFQDASTPFSIDSKACKD